MIIGNLIGLAEQGKFDVIIHGCNCFCTMESGIAGSLKRRHPGVLQADMEFASSGDKSKLGKYSQHIVTMKPGRHFVVINAYTQYNYGRGKKYADYGAIKRVFRSLAPVLDGMRIGYPRIGCGLAGGDWKLVEGIINEAFEGMDHEMVALR